MPGIIFKLLYEIQFRSVRGQTGMSVKVGVRIIFKNVGDHFTSFQDNKLIFFGGKLPDFNNDGAVGSQTDRR